MAQTSSCLKPSPAEPHKGATLDRVSAAENTQTCRLARHSTFLAAVTAEKCQTHVVESHVREQFYLTRCR